MKIHRLTAVAVKGLREIDIEPAADAHLVILGGKNGAGKSSVLDAIWAALGGASAVPERPIRDGEASAEVTLDLGEIVVRRRWLRDGAGTLRVETKDGMSPSKPQAFLDRLVGPLSFDPLAFARMKPTEQQEALRAVVGLDLTVHDAEIARVYGERRDTARDLRALEARLGAMPEVEAPDEEISVAELLGVLTAAQERNRDIEAAWQLVDQLHAQVTTRAARVEQAEKAVRDAQDALARAVEQADNARTALEQASENAAAAGKAEDLGPLRAAIEGAEATNVLVRQRAVRTEVARQVAQVAGVVAKIEADVERARKEKAAAIAAATFPVEGLSIGDEGVLYRGIPFAQACSAEQLRVSLGMGLALNPELRVILIRDGSLLDAANLAVVEEMAKAADAQVWIERVGTDGPVTYVIEDGCVAAQGGAR